eukprot:1157253-Pelagomonas_calceolata.AAC.3
MCRLQEWRGPPYLLGYAPYEVPSYRCWSGKPGKSFLRTPWQGFCLLSGPHPGHPPEQTECAELLKGVQTKTDLKSPNLVQWVFLMEIRRPGSGTAKT